MRKAAITWLLFALASVPAPAGFAQRPDEPLDPALLAGLKARSIGPAAMSGRIAALDVVRSDPRIIWVGAATGGLWKSTNAGLAFEPVFDDQPIASIGAIAVNQANPSIVWVGTGEGNPRNSASVGDGVYKTIDAGETWTHVGLPNTERIARIVLHPRRPEVAWVAAMGQAWGESHERGVYKTEDGGRTWRHVLFVNDTTGAADLVQDPENPDKLIVAMWDYRRWPWFFRSGGPGSGLHVSFDGGETWTQRTAADGLPAGELGRIGLAIAPSNPLVVYAYVEAKKENVIARSDDGGKTFRVVGRGERIGNRPFYYADLRVDPRNENRVYSLWSQVSVSQDGGKTFEVLIGWDRAHPDHHALWVDPDDPRHLIDGNDGGVSISRDGGKSWRFVRNLPLAQFYHVRVDDEIPYNVYGGLQDNGSWKGPSEVWEQGGIRNHRWQEVCFGDGFDTVPDPADPMQGWAMSQQGHLVRWNLRTGERKDVRPAGPEGVPLRFSWNAGLAIDPFDGKTLYFGSQLVHRSRDRGESWEVISEDLTTDEADWQRQHESGGLTLDVTGAENFTTIVAIAPSPLEFGLIWVGTDDGRLHVTRDGGREWLSVEERLDGVPANTWIPQIEPSPHDPATAFVVLDDHRRSNLEPYLYRTRDYGATWERLPTDEVDGYALSVVQDPVEPDLLFLGTELGLWVSRDAGKSWFKWTHGVPTCSVMDMTIQRRAHDLVLGTHGRAAFILDDIRPLRTLAAARGKRLHLFPVGDAWRHRRGRPASSRFAGQGEFQGENRPYGALVSFWVDAPGVPHPDEKRAPAAESDAKDEPKVEVVIKDEDGDVIRTFERRVKRGLNRITWNLRRRGFDRPRREPREDDAAEPEGPEVLPGRYTVTLRLGDDAVSGPIVVRPDPRNAGEVTVADRRANFDMLMRLGRYQQLCADAVSRIQEARVDIDAALARLPKDGEETKKLRESASGLKEKLEHVEKRWWSTPDTKGIPAREQLATRVSRVQGAVASHEGSPTAAQLASAARLEADLRRESADLNALFAGGVATFAAGVEQQRVEIMRRPPPLTIE